ncbi:MAG: WYL domain-containing protein [Lachnospiraceae bacterium]|nr:WYL domain-containing protein [Lachnospiraceae bacterium]
MAYHELIKNFQRIRDYMREFYVYGFKSREEFDKKSARSYDNERRRIESYLGDFMEFHQTGTGKNVFLSIDSRNSIHNPLYKALKTKSFTDGDITLHFILFDILYTPELQLSIDEITDKIDNEYLYRFSSPMFFDTSTVRKKLKEYTELGLLTTSRQGRQMLYRRTGQWEISPLTDMLEFFSETAPCGVIGSFLLDKTEIHREYFTFKHHYITHALESEILCRLFEAISEKRCVTITNYSRRTNYHREFMVIPLKIFIGVQSGRCYLMSYNLELHCMKSYRLDYISVVQLQEPSPDFDRLREILHQIESHMWGISCNVSLEISNGYEKMKEFRLEHVEFTLRIDASEEYIYQRLKREKRCGTVERLDEHTCRFTADVFDTGEMIPWIRTFICRIASMDFSNRTIENQFRKDLEEMYQLYNIGGNC